MAPTRAGQPPRGNQQTQMMVQLPCGAQLRNGGKFRRRAGAGGDVLQNDQPDRMPQRAQHVSQVGPIELQGGRHRPGLLPIIGLARWQTHSPHDHDIARTILDPITQPLESPELVPRPCDKTTCSGRALEQVDHPVEFALDAFRLVLHP